MAAAARSSRVMGGETCHVSGGSLPLHSAPGDDAAVRDMLVPALALPEHTAILARTVDGWFQLAGGWARAAELSGACFNIPVAPASPGAATGCFLRPLVDYANVREGPFGRVVARLDEHEFQPALGENYAGDWLFYRAGWVSRSVVELFGVCNNLPKLDPAQVSSGTIHYCPPGYLGILPPRIAIGDATAQVVSDRLVNRLRASPELEAEQIGEIPPRAVIDAVLDGPACNAPFVWWQVRAGDVIGWTVESDVYANHYYLAPWRSAGGVATTSDASRRAASAEPRKAAERPMHSGNVMQVDTLRVVSAQSPGAVAFSPQGSWLAAITNGSVTLFDARTFQPVDQLSPALDSQHVTALAFSRDERFLALGDAAGSVRLAPLGGGRRGTQPRIIGSLEGRVKALAWSPTGGKLAAVGGDDSPGSNHQPGALKVWQVMRESPADIQTQLYYSFPYSLTALAFSRDGKWLAVTGESLRQKHAAIWIYASDSGDLAISKTLLPSYAQVMAPPSAALGDFVTSSGDNLHQLAIDGGDDLRFYHQAGSALEHIAFSPASIAGAESLFAVALRDRAGKPELHIGNALSAFSPTLRLSVEASALAFSPDGSLLAVAQRDRDRLLILGVTDQA